MSRTLQPAIQSCDTGQRIHFLTAVDQLTKAWISLRMSTIKLNKDYICLGHIASNGRTLQENNAAFNSQSYRSSHSIVAI